MIGRNVKGRIVLHLTKYGAVGVAKRAFVVPYDGLLLIRTKLRDTMSRDVEAATTIVWLDISSTESRGVDYVGDFTVGRSVKAGVIVFAGGKGGEEGMKIGLVGAVGGVVTLIVKTHLV